MKCRNNPDLNLAILEAVLPRGIQLTQQEIANATGFSQPTICKTEQSALQKLKARFSSEKIGNRVRVQAKETISAVAFGEPVALAITAAASDALPSSIVWMPAGSHQLTAHTMDGPGFQGKIICDEQAARSVMASFEKIHATGQRVWLDCDHDDGAAAAWVKSFSWDAARGILAHVEWTSRGESAIRGKEFFSFSPAFWADPKTGRVVGLLSGHAAGGLVNAPAFGAAMPALIAARFGGAHQNQPAPGGKPEKDIMKELLIKILAALKVTPPADATEDQLVALVAKNMPADNSAEVAELKKQIDAAKAADDAGKVAAVQAKKDADAKLAEIEKKQTELAAVQAAINARQSADITVTASIEDTIKGYALLGPESQARGLFFKEKLTPVIARIGGNQFARQLCAAVNVLAKNTAIQANTLGTLVGSLIAQQSLALLKYEFPILSMLSSDYSNMSAKWNQTIDTRLKSALAASQYAGTYTAAATTLTDVPVVINHHPYCQVGFTVAELGGTNRDLFGEQVEVVNYAIGLDIVNALYALMIAANFTTTPLVLGGTGGGTGSTDGTGYNRSSAVAAAKQLFVNKQPRAGRFNLLNADAFGGLGADAAVVSLAAFQKSSIITGYELPPIADMQPIQVVNLPTTASKVAFAGSPRALAIATRVPNDYTTALPGASYGNVSQVTDPDTGITVQVVQYVNHDTGTANYRVALMYGVAVGDPLAAVITTHA